ncbi:ABC transporter substrate-binding protein [Marinomonas transparens]|uniref:Extracellular solute-binding protein n=1 Tax=Marinomonas transparens TaxID=2795388 RepID=A0A934JUY0_9GAMM|nr:extracellular solute-binding protein [Marinomonas transparens]MBJ7538757.1 extracellular solute-binding protein [Marinomonas transparens]
MKDLVKKLTVIAFAFSAVSAASAVELSILIDNNPDTVALTQALTLAYSKKHPDVKFEMELRPGGAEGDNIVKTRLATGEMADVFIYNSGSLLQALRPSRTLEPINDIANFSNILSSFTSTVSDKKGNVYAVPAQTAMGGGILYNKRLYKELGLKVPMTWKEFMANCAIIAAKSKAAPIAQTYRDSWTSQLIVLADYYNVQSEQPNFADDYTNNKAKFATTPSALRGFEKLQQVSEAGYFNDYYGAATYNDGLNMVATGKAAHYPMLTFAIPAININTPDQINDVGFFAQPGDDASKNGLTVWMPNAFYLPKEGDHKDIAKDFLSYVATVDACNTITNAIGANGPYLIKGCTLPDNVFPAVKDMLPYFQVEGRTAPALEFLSPIKGPMLEQLTVEVGSSIRTAKSAAELYDQDVEKQAKQLNLPNW